MANKTIKHFIFTRFFSFYDAKYPHDIFDVNFLQKQLPLTRNALSSLENQTNKNFELIFVLHPKFFDDTKYEFIFSTLKENTILPIKFMKNVAQNCFFSPRLNNELLSLFKVACAEYDFVVTSRIDFDDFIYKDAVADTQSKVDECDSILAYGYCRGYEYGQGELYPYFQPWVGGGHPGILQSLILKSSFADKLPCVGVESFRHHAIKTDLQNFLKTNGVTFSENMFQQNTSTNAFIYFRHTLSHSVATRENVLESFSKRKNLITKEITKRQLKEEFGFTLELKSIKDEERSFDYDFTSTQAEEFGFRQDLTSIKYL